MNRMNRSDADRLAHATSLWQHVGRERPAFALPTKAGQESVWDYPRPPRLAADSREVVVMAGSLEIARSRQALRLLETASPPGFYLPAQDVCTDCLVPASGSSQCEWKGQAAYWSVLLPGGGMLDRVAWSYAHPLAPYEAMAGFFGFYPQHLDCRVDGLRVQPQPGGFYAGWITPEVVGPFKGGPGSGGW
jgi:uncharacterized protein (DUF427 family)